MGSRYPDIVIFDDDTRGGGSVSAEGAGDQGLGLFDAEAEYRGSGATATRPVDASAPAALRGIAPAQAPAPLPSDRLPIDLDPRGRRAARAAQRAEERTSANAVAARTPAATGASAPAAAASTSTTRAGHRSANSTLAADLRRGAGLGTLAVAGLLSIAIFVGSGYYWYTFRNLTANIQRVDAIPAKGNDGPGAPVMDVDGTDQNILIAGNDDRSTATSAELKQIGTQEDGGSLNTDTIMILHAPADGRTASIISIPRDTYVSIPGYGMSKINSAYPYGVNSGAGKDTAAGAQLLVKTVQNLTGLTIDHFVQVDLIGFYRISNAIGGVPVNMCNAVKDPYSQINLHKGINVIQGGQALAFVRQRHGLAAGDFDRTRRQQYFLTAVFKQMSSAGVLLNPSKLSDLMGAISSSLHMDRTLDPLKLAAQFLNLSAGSIKTQTIPSTGFGNHNGQSTVEVDPAAVKTFVKAVINANINDPTRPSPSPSASASPAPSGAGIAVEVQNAGAPNGSAARNATALNALGFKAVASTKQPPVASTTLIKYPESMFADAQVVQQNVPGATLQPSSSVTKITIVLGSDGVNATGTVVTSTPVPSATSKAPKVVAPNPAATGACIN